ncbi:arginine--tRNA ligase [Futiania mangrovi]|uniref:Arginine--tRNA ligase n=1 Tax=Futiania mangrovi TaxID=2959716 RepID=A0A9J6PDT7_9PROT|nr:arginine--tRNA ligase [Futiania mangrovii]MCP1335984.1 arginine--tRNA ligase [Futiania mangrovii]
MSVFSDISAELEAVLDRLVSEGVLPDGIDRGPVTVEPPRDPSHGDLATNAAMVLAKKAGMKPRDLAEKIAGGLREAEGVVAVDIAGPGFINLRLSPARWQREVATILSRGTDYGRSQTGAGELVNVEYVSANPTGPLHVGHCRGAVFGDALARLLQFAGFEVVKEYYINDAGAQVDVLGRSAFLRYREALGEDIGEIPEGLYPGDYLKPVGVALADAHGRALLDMDEEAWLPIARQTAVDMMMAMIRDDLDVLAIRHDVFTSERGLVESGAVDRALADLESRGLIYEGVLEPPKGKTPDDWEPRPQLLFRATDFGDDVDRPLKKSDGSYTYFASDIAYHKDKVDRGARSLIDVWGADHGGYVTRMQAAVRALTQGQGDLDVKLCQIVRLFRAGEPVRMSKRAGSFVTLRDVVDEVGPDVVRFMMLTRKNDAQLDFDFAKVLEQSKDNPVFYVQYAHARVCSVLRNAAAELPGQDLADAALAEADLKLLADEGELGLARKLGEFPRMVEQAARAHEPHRVAFYLEDLAASFHAHWNRGKEEPSLRFILSDKLPLTLARLALIRAVAVVLSAGLGLMGVTPVEDMR